MEAIRRADEPLHAAIVRDRAHWGQIDVHLNGRVYTSGGHGFSAVSRTGLVTLMQRRAGDLGVELHYESEAPRADALDGYDLIVGADGVNSDVRAAHADVFRPSVEPGACKFIWLATDQAYDAFKFFIVETPHGILQVHAYPYDRASRPSSSRCARRSGDAPGSNASRPRLPSPGTATWRASRS